MDLIGFKNTSSIISALNNPKYSNLKPFSSCVLLYSLLLEKQKESNENECCAEESSRFVYFKIDEISSVLRITHKTAICLIRSLKENGLIQVKRQGSSKPNAIFINKIENNEIYNKEQSLDLKNEQKNERDSYTTSNEASEKTRDSSIKNNCLNSIKNALGNIKNTCNNAFDISFNKKKLRKKAFNPLLKRSKEENNKIEEIKEIFEHYKSELNYPNALLDNARFKIIHKALYKLHFDKESIKTAISGVKHSPFHLGINSSGSRFDSLKIILRDSDQIEKFITIYKRKDNKYIPAPVALSLAKEFISEIQIERLEPKLKSFCVRTQEAVYEGFDRIVTNTIGFKKPEENNSYKKLIYELTSKNFTIEEIKSPSTEVRSRFYSIYKHAININLNNICTALYDI